MNWESKFYQIIGQPRILRILALIFVFCANVQLFAPKPGDPLGYYEILGVGKDANEGEIKEARDAKAKEAHPDKGGREDVMQKINGAYEILSHPIKKRIYDFHCNKSQNFFEENGIMRDKNAFYTSEELDECLWFCQKATGVLRGASYVTLCTGAFLWLSSLVKFFPKKNIKGQKAIRQKKLERQKKVDRRKGLILLGRGLPFVLCGYLSLRFINKFMNSDTFIKLMDWLIYLTAEKKRILPPPLPTS